MKTVFFGTPEFAVPSLEALIRSPHEVVGVVSAPDRPAGRGMILTPPPVAMIAQQLGLPLRQPENLRDDEFLRQLRYWNAGVFAVVAFRILPEEVFLMPPHGAINLHASLLPAYRGAAPINWALWNGEVETGLTTFRIEKAVDTGNILLQQKVKIQDEDDAGSLAKVMSQVGSDLLVRTLTELAEGRLLAQPQDHSKASPAPKITKEHGRIDWQRSAPQIRHQIRALSPEPAAYTTFEDQSLKIFRAEVLPDDSNIEAGTAQVSDQEITVGTGQGCLRILELQLQGKNKMDVKTFLRGFRPRGTFKLS